MRHGESQANQQGLIVSAPSNGINGYGLSEHGQHQVRQSVQQALEQGFTPTRILSSDFKRAQETAQLAQQGFACAQDIVFYPHLRERFFGELELGSHGNYQRVWDKDVQDSAHTAFQVESADSVLERTTGLVQKLEKDFSNEVFLLVAHGDTLQILQTAFQQVPVTQHRALQHLNTAEIRELKLSSQQAHR
ncbi:MAG: histidine phosphatase family protein [Thiolinea sp.]